jgi:putative heme-binding domain-containing protein
MSDNAARFLRGRIYRVASDSLPAVVPPWDWTTAKGALAALGSHNKATQYVAFKALQGMGESAMGVLREAAEEGDPRVRARALALLARNPAAALPSLARALRDTDSDLVVTGIRLATHLQHVTALDSAARKRPFEELTAALLTHPDPQVRRQLAVSLHSQPGRAKAWAQLAAQHDGSDRWYLEALGIGAAGADQECFAAWLSEVNGNWNTPGGRDILWRLRTPKTAPYLAALLKAEPGQMRYMRAFDFLPESLERTEALLELARANPSLAVLTESLQRLFKTQAKDTPELQEILSSALQRSKGQPAFVDLLSAAGVGAHADALLQTATSLGNAPEALEAVELLMRTPAGVEKIRTTLRKASAGEADALVRILGSLGRTAAMDILAGEILAAGPVERRSMAVRALARTQTGAAHLVGLAKEGRYPAELRGAGQAALAMVQYANLKQDIAAHFPQPVALDGKALPPVQELAKMSGDAAKGKLLFESPGSSCVICHRIGEVGADFGPGLGAIGAKLPKEALFEAILNPNAGISMGFETSELKMRGGGEALGIVRSETEDELILVLPGGALQRVAKTEIKGLRKLQTSMMPSGINQALSQKDLIDLVEYLTAQRAAQ